jgi:hypothetical protein
LTISVKRNRETAPLQGTRRNMGVRVAESERRLNEAPLRQANALRLVLTYEK